MFRAAGIRMVFIALADLKAGGRWAVLCVTELTGPSVFSSCFLKNKTKQNTTTKPHTHRNTPQNNKESEDSKSRRWN